MDQEILNDTEINRIEIDHLIQLALEEDKVEHDLTTFAAGFSTAAEAPPVTAKIIAKKQTLAAGYPLVLKILKIANASAKVHANFPEGAILEPGAEWIIFKANAYDLLRLERVILNFLMRTCGIAENTRKAVLAVAGTNCKILHTRKTAPGHRYIDIYAALVGGALAHRQSLSDAILVKENHLQVVKSFQDLFDGIGSFRKEARFVEIEVINFTELKHALMAKPDRILLDNFSVQDVERAVKLFGSSVELEASGGINLENIHQFAQTGVDYISMGSLTHSSPAADLSLLIKRLDP